MCQTYSVLRVIVTTLLFAGYFWASSEASLSRPPANSGSANGFHLENEALNDIASVLNAAHSLKQRQFLEFMGDIESKWEKRPKHTASYLIVKAYIINEKLHSDGTPENKILARETLVKLEALRSRHARIAILIADMRVNLLKNNAPISKLRERLDHLFRSCQERRDNLTKLLQNNCASYLSAHALQLSKKPRNPNLDDLVRRLSYLSLAFKNESETSISCQLIARGILFRFTGYPEMYLANMLDFGDTKLKQQNTTKFDKISAMAAISSALSNYNSHSISESAIKFARAGLEIISSLSPEVKTLDSIRRLHGELGIAAGDAYMHFPKPKDAIVMYNRAIYALKPIRNRLPKTRKHQFAMALSAAALAYMISGDNQEAEELYFKALGHFDKVYWVGHPIADNTVTNLGILLNNSNQSLRAIKLMEKRRKYFLFFNRDVLKKVSRSSIGGRGIASGMVKFQNVLSQSYLNTGKPRKALERLGEILDFVGPSDANAKGSYHLTMAFAEYRLGQFDQAARHANDIGIPFTQAGNPV